MNSLWTACGDVVSLWSVSEQTSILIPYLHLRGNAAAVVGSDSYTDVPHADDVWPAQIKATEPRRIGHAISPLTTAAQ